MKFKGKMYTELSLLQTDGSGADSDLDFSGKSVFSLNVKNSKRKFAKVAVSFDVILPYGASVLEYDDAADSIAADWNDSELFSFGKTPVIFDLRRLYASVYLPFADITMGRQFINYGKGVFFSPLDQFSAVELNDLNFRRCGSDIINVSIPLSDLSGLDLTAELPFLDESHSTAAKYFNAVHDLDFSIITIFKHANGDSSVTDRLLSGVTCKGDLELGLYGEALLNLETASGKCFFEGMVGGDYSIRSILIFNLEYLYRQQDLLTGRWGEHNLFSSVNYLIDDLTKISTAFAYDFNNELTVGSAQYFYNILQNVNVAVFIQGIDTADDKYMKYSGRIEVLF